MKPKGGAGHDVALANMLRSASDAVIGLNLEGVIEHWNPAAESLYGHSRVQAVGQNVRVLFPSDHAEALGGRIRAALSGVASTYQGAQLGRAGRRFACSISVSPIQDSSGQSTGCSLFVRADELPERPSEAAALQGQKAENDELLSLAQRARELERSNADLEHFTYVVSHELQEPLRAVTSYLDLLRRRYGSTFDDKAERFVSHAQRGAQRMQRLIDDLLTYSRVRTRAIERCRVDADACLEAALQNLDVLLKETGGEVESQPLPDAMADQTQLTEVFQNLIHNALKFRSTEAPVVRVTGGVDRGLSWYRVSDNGVGIPVEQRLRVFQLFQRLHRDDRLPGTGIGLAICQSIVERHGGSIRVEASSDGGADFVFSLPAGDEGG